MRLMIDDIEGEHSVVLASDPNKNKRLEAVIAISPFLIAHVSYKVITGDNSCYHSHNLVEVVREYNRS